MKCAGFSQSQTTSAWELVFCLSPLPTTRTILRKVEDFVLRHGSHQRRTKWMRGFFHADDCATPGALSRGCCANNVDWSFHWVPELGWAARLTILISSTPRNRTKNFERQIEREGAMSALFTRRSFLAFSLTCKIFDHEDVSFTDFVRVLCQPP